MIRLKHIKAVKCLTMLFCIGVTNLAFSDSESAGVNGIDAINIGTPLLDGTGVIVGQVERDRSATPLIDSDPFRSDFIVPGAVSIYNEFLIPADQHLGTGHTTLVAGVMISTDERNLAPIDGITPVGFAQGIDLQSAAYTSAVSPGTYERILDTTGPIATIDNAVIVNHSYGVIPKSGDTTDGNSLLTMGMDWLAAEQDVLQVFAGNQDNDGAIILSDNYNGMTIASSTKVGNQFNRVHFGNDFFPAVDAVGTRTSVDILAPGDDIQLTGGGNAQVVRSGTSLSAPHVSGTAALLHQYANSQITNSVAGWGNDALLPQVKRLF